MTGGATPRFAVLGHPVHHSLSPRMQNAAFRAVGIDAAYVALDVPPVRLEAALAGLHEEGFQGLNVTLPHKEEAFRLMERLTPEAREAGAVNTLRRTGRGWEGHTTDGPGFLAWLDELGIDVRGEPVLLLGAGGAARSVAHPLAARGASALWVVNRTAERAGALAWEVERLRPATRGRYSGTQETPPALEGDKDGPWSLMIRAVSAEAIGPEEERWWRSLPQGTPVLDLNYGPRAAESRDRAARQGLPFHDGLGLLLHQGILSFEFWTGREAPRDVMRLALDSAAG